MRILEIHGAVTALATLMLLVPLLARADANLLSLETALEQAVNVSPLVAAAYANADVRRGELNESGIWPNPHIEVEVGNRIAREGGPSGWQTQAYAISQALPIGGRLTERRRVSEFLLSAAHKQVVLAVLGVEYQAAVAFHQLQWAIGRADLALAQLQQAKHFHKVAEERSQAGDLSVRETLRLQLLLHEAEASLDDALRTQRDAELHLLTLLAFQPGEMFDLPPLTMPAMPVDIELLQQLQDNHPALAAAQQQQFAAMAQRDEVNAERIPDLELRLGRDNEMFDGRRGASYSVGLQVELPLWSNGKGRLQAKDAEVRRAQDELRLVQTEAQQRLRQSHSQLTRLLDRIQRHQLNVLARAEQVLAMTERGYNAGELTLTELIDATQAQWRAAQEQLDLLLLAQQQDTELRRALGKTVSSQVEHRS